MTYQLKKEKGGAHKERTYEFTAPKPPQNRPPQNHSRQANFSAPQKTSRPTTPPPPAYSYRLRQENGGRNSERTYEFNINMPKPHRPAARRNTAQTAHYVMNKNGRRVQVRSQAEYLAIKKEREEALSHEHKRILEEAAAAEAERNIRTVTAKEHNPVPIGFIAVVIFCTLLFMYMIYNMVIINERTREITVLNKQLTSLTSQQKDIENALEKKNDLIFIEDYAVNKLGMVKSDRLSRQYVSIDTHDRIEVVGDDSAVKEDSKFVIVRDRILNKIKNVWEYIS